MALSYPTLERNSLLDKLTADIGNAALLRIYDGTPPASANAALSGNNKLAELTCGTPFAPASAGGVLTANAITSANALATGTAMFFRLYKSDGVTVIMQGTVGTSGGDLNLNATAIVSGTPVQVNSFAITEGDP